MRQLPASDQQRLLKIARESVEAHLRQQEFHAPETLEGLLAENHGAFVSIHKGNELRGCIGNLSPTLTLSRTVADCAVAAAVEDPRFPPLTVDELEKVEFEISVLSPFEIVDNVETIEIGRHGLLISKRSARGLLLPQVPVTYGWGRERFLAETCRKAGLKPDEWKEGAVIFSFTADVFGETSIGEKAAS